MTAPERIWVATPYDDPNWESPCGEWDVSEHWAVDDKREYILHTRAALAASPLVQEIVAEAVKAEREACAKVADDLGWPGQMTQAEYDALDVIDEAVMDRGTRIAAAIRARGEGQPQEKGE